MRKTLYEISQEYKITPNTLRVAIHRGLLEAEKVGHIRIVDDNSESFKKYLAQNKARVGTGNIQPVTQVETLPAA